MNEEEIQKHVDDWCGHLLKTDGTIDQKMVLRLCQEIERITRQRIVSSLSSVATAVDQRVDLREILRKVM